MHCDHEESTQSWSGKPRRGHVGAALPLILCQSGGGGGGRVTDNLTTVNHDNTPVLWLVPTFLGKDHHWWRSSPLSSLSLSLSLATVNEVVFLSEEGYDESSMMLTILMVRRRKSKTYVIMMMMMMMMI